MDISGLKEIATTLIVGSFVVLIAEFVSFFTFGVPITHVFDRSDRRKRKGETQLFLFACFALGLITEDSLWKSRSAIDLGGIPRRVLCRGSIFEDLRAEPQDVSRVRLQSAVLVRGLFTDAPEVQPLALQLADNHLFSRIDGPSGAEVETWLRKVHDAARPGIRPKVTATYRQVQRFTSSMLKVWYEAHNRVFQNDGYREEMLRIETRQRFSGTLAQLAYIAFWFSLIGGLAMLIAIVETAARPPFRNWVLRKIPKRPRRFHALLALPPYGLGARSRKYLLPLALRCLLLYGMYFFGIWAHTRESLEFNKRTFGYYNSLAFETANHITESETGAPAHDSIARRNP